MPPYWASTTSTSDRTPARWSRRSVARTACVFAAGSTSPGLGVQGRTLGNVTFELGVELAAEVELGAWVGLDGREPPGEEGTGVLAPGLVAAGLVGVEVALEFVQPVSTPAPSSNNPRRLSDSRLDKDPLLGDTVDVEDALYGSDGLQDVAEVGRIAHFKRETGLGDAVAGGGESGRQDVDVIVGEDPGDVGE